jgi:hypothetical protein
MGLLSMFNKMTTLCLSVMAGLRPALILQLKNGKASSFSADKPEGLSLHSTKKKFALPADELPFSGM